MEINFTNKRNGKVNKFTEAFTVRKYAPWDGWFIMGHNSEVYGVSKVTGKGAYVQAVAYPGHKRNGMPKGFKSKREALAILPTIIEASKEV